MCIMANVAMEARLNKAKAEQGKQKKGKFGTRKAEDQTPAKAADQKPATPEPEKKPELTPEKPAETPAAAEGSKAKKAKKDSPQVIRWKATPNFPLDHVITEIMKDHPKRKNAKVRFEMYE